MTDNLDLLRKVKCLILCISAYLKSCGFISMSQFLNLHAAAEHCEIPQFSSINVLVWCYRKILMNTWKLEEFDIFEI